MLAHGGVICGQEVDVLKQLLAVAALVWAWVRCVR